MEKNITTYSPEETRKLAAGLAGGLSAGDVIALIGELGAGKTMFVKGLAAGLKVRDKYVNSPSFVILKEYPGDNPMYHFDVYRLDRKDFEETLDYRAYFYGDGVSVVEWADKIRDLLPEEYLEIEITYGEDSGRMFCFRPVGERFKALVAGIEGRD